MKLSEEDLQILLKNKKVLYSLKVMYKLYKPVNQKHIIQVILKNLKVSWMNQNLL